MIFDDKDVKNVLDGILSSIDNENQFNYSLVESLPVMQDAVKNIKENNCEMFYLSLIYPINKVIDGLLSKEIPQSSEARFLFKNSRFVEDHFEYLIQKFEGHACCADKSSMIVGSLAKSLKTGTEIVFDYDQEYTYHLPKKIFKTHDEIMRFFKALQSLFYGKSDLYINEISEIYKNS